MNQDLQMMKPQLFPNNQVFCLTPEHKIDRWIEIIQKTALDGNKVKLYSDIESTGFAYWNRGRAGFDEVIDAPMLRKDSEKWFLEIEVITNENFNIALNHPFAKSAMFSMKEPSSFACFVLGQTVIENSGILSWDEMKEAFGDHSLGLEYYNGIFDAITTTLKKELIFEAKQQIKSLQGKAFRFLKKEATELEGKVDRMIEFAFVACYENVNGEVFLLKDDDGDLIYFHEFVNPNDGKIPEKQVVEHMPIIPYIIHKTSFEFLKAEEMHPFLNIKLDKPAPDSGEIFRVLLRLLDNNNASAEDKAILSDNIMFFYHNGNGFDVPFIDEEMNRFFEDHKLRDFSQVYDTLKIAKKMIPSDVQKFIAACQHNKNFGGKEELKNDSEVGIMPTSKSLDNIKRLASFLSSFDPNKPKRIYEKAQEHFYQEFKKYFESEEINWQKFDNMVEYTNNKSTDLNLTKGFKKPTKKEPVYQTLMDRYSKYQDGRKDYVKLLNNLKKHELLYNNIHNIKDNINNNEFLKDALFRLNNIDRSAHGARVDSQLFMDAFIVLENALYLKPKMATKKRSIQLDSLEIPADMQALLEKKLKGE